MTALDVFAYVFAAGCGAVACMFVFFIAVLMAVRSVDLINAALRYAERNEVVVEHYDPDQRVIVRVYRKPTPDRVKRAKQEQTK